MTTTAITLHLRHTPGSGWFIIEHNPAVVFASTGTNERVISGPWLSVEQAIDERQCIADAFDVTEAVAS